MICLERDIRQYLLSVARDRTRDAGHLPDRGGVYDHDGVQKRYLGACGEYAVAAALGLPFQAKTFGSDVGRYEVRTGGGPHYHLPIQERDLQEKPDTPYILVTRAGEACFQVRGWYTPAGAAQHPEWWRSMGTYPPQWYVPQRVLHALVDLPL